MNGAGARKSGRNVLAIGAHPDDIELGCGGALLAHAAAGDSVTMLVVTGGENGPGDAVRREEQERAARVLGARLVWGGLRDCEVVADSATVRVIEQVLQDTRADLVYVHAPEDSHQDHRAVAAATLGATRRLSRVLHYQSPSTLSFTPTVYVDVTAYLSGKVAALSAHASQVELSAMVEPDAVVASARHWGAQARIGYAEAFQPTRLVLDLVPVSGFGVAAIPAAWQLAPSLST
ncbi:PIG-L family deacetylase [Blastococcus sp. TML/M2B]|uniref:PIG-L deacetylase family protein n=1 Tax=unclassified Blastococcus TaxID=2619396 RepID=UPI00190B468B|nr:MULTISPECIES: PIG-L deacetylase family protein [unclassified Blastococcus]MBN1091416.1 PIG-L family deacetylase [Blastococcus sp. TML/M2B]MBN1095028.1 PIG-L family deacetylase [Blastococcus sp. TML/C7B]